MRFGYTVDAVALTASTLRTLLELTAPSDKSITVYQLWCEFDNITPGTPIKYAWQKYSAGVTTATSVTPIGQGNMNNVVSGCTLKHSATVEGAGAATAGSGEIHRIAPTSGIIMLYPLDRELIVGPAEVWRLLATPGVNTANATFGIDWEE